MRRALLAFAGRRAARRELRRRRRRHRSAPAGELRLRERRARAAHPLVRRHDQRRRQRRRRQDEARSRARQPEDVLRALRADRGDGGRSSRGWEPGGDPVPASPSLSQACLHNVDPGDDPEPGRIGPAHVPVPARAGAVHRPRSRAAAAPAHGPVRADRVGHAHQRAGRDAGVRLPLPRQLQPAAGAVAADLCDDARPAPALACGGLARAACGPGAPLVARSAGSRRHPSPSPSPHRSNARSHSWSGRSRGTTAPSAGQPSTLSRRSWTWWRRTAWPTRHASPPGRRRIRRPARRSESSRS